MRFRSSACMNGSGVECLLLSVIAAAVVMSVGAAQLIDPEQGEPHGEPQQHNCIGGTHGHLAAPAVLLVSQPVLHLLLCFLDYFLVHAGVTLHPRRGA